MEVKGREKGGKKQRNIMIEGRERKGRGKGRGRDVMPGCGL